MNCKYELFKIYENFAHLFEPTSLNILKVACDEKTLEEDDKSLKRAKVYDYSNFVNIRKIYLESQTSEAMETYAEFTSLYKLKNCEVLEYKEELAEVTVLENKQPYQVLEHFLGEYLNHCKKEITKEKKKKIMQAVDTIHQYRREEKKEAIVLDYPCIQDIYYRLQSKSRRLSSCDWGVGKIYIGGNGRLYRCGRHQEIGTTKDVKELGLLYLVDDISSCKGCSIRYLCGGKCEYEAETTNLCTVIRQAIRCIIEKYIIDEF